MRQPCPQGGVASFRLPLGPEALPPHPMLPPCVIEVQGRRVVKRGEATIQEWTNETGTHTAAEKRTHNRDRGASCLQPGSMGSEAIGNIQPQHPTLLRLRPIRKRFRYAAAPHAFCILAGPRSLKMDGMQPAQPSPSPVRHQKATEGFTLKQTAMRVRCDGHLSHPSNPTVLPACSLQAPPRPCPGLV